MITSDQSLKFVETLEEFGFSLEDWEFLETMLANEGLRDEQMQDLEKLRATLKEVTEKYSL